MSAKKSIIAISCVLFLFFTVIPTFSVTQAELQAFENSQNPEPTVANIDLVNMLSKQQQTFTMLSIILKIRSKMKILTIIPFI